MEDAAATVIPDAINILRLLGMDINHVSGGSHDVKQSHAHSSSHMDMAANMNPLETMYFLINDLKVGKIIPTYFPEIDPSKSFHFLPRQQADSIPFSSKALPYLLRFFSFSQDSPQAKAMEETLSQCELEPAEGEIKYCATSFESLLDFPRSVFGSDSQFQILTTSRITKSSSFYQNYTVVQPKEITAPKMIACHNMPYPYTFYICHTQNSETKVFKVSLSGEDGNRVEAISVCHMDTSQWNPNHVAFRRLGVKPGTSAVCHFFPADDLVIVPL
ncbi:hypothetical protein REPUB_Repub04eG0061600 [Reevesia pubescens]